MRTETVGVALTHPRSIHEKGIGVADASCRHYTRCYCVGGDWVEERFSKR